MVKFLQFLGYFGAMLGMVFLIVSGVLGGFRPAWRYMRMLVTHIAALAALGIVLAGIVGLWLD